MTLLAPLGLFKCVIAAVFIVSEMLGTSSTPMIPPHIQYTDIQNTPRTSYSGQLLLKAVNLVTVLEAYSTPRDLPWRHRRRDILQAVCLFVYLFGHTTMRRELASNHGC